MNNDNLLREKLEKQDGYGLPKYIEVIDENGYITYEYID